MFYKRNPCGSLIAYELEEKVSHCKLSYCAMLCVAIVTDVMGTKVQINDASNSGQGIGADRSIGGNLEDARTTFDQHPPDKGYGSTVLIVDDDLTARESLQTICFDIEPRCSFRTLSCATVEEALRILSETAVDVVLLDKNIGSEGSTEYQNGIEAIPEFLRLQCHLQILMVTGSSDISDVVRAITLGAFNYVVKGSPADLLIAQIKQAATVAQLTLSRIRAERTPARPSVNVLAGSSPAMLQLKNQLEMVAESNRAVLLLGDSGTGKTTVAKLVHEFRQRYLKQNDRPFIALNMASISSTMAEGELFGNEAGAYTDAKVARPGYIELANHGTLFLDEIGEASLELQAKLLKVLDEGKFFRLGGKKEIQSRFKLVCATNRNLEEMVAQGRFRQDLYMRISTFPVRMPALEERREDIPEIVKSLLPKCCEENQVFVDYAELPEDFVEFLKENRIEGNIRGIDHCLSRLLVYSPKDKRGRPQFQNWRSIVMPFLRRPASKSFVTQITLKDLLNAQYDVVGPDFPGLRNVIHKIEENIVREALEKLPTQMAAGNTLKISKGAFSVKLKRLGINIKGESTRPKGVKPLAGNHEDRRSAVQ